MLTRFDSAKPWIRYGELLKRIAGMFVFAAIHSHQRALDSKTQTGRERSSFCVVVRNVPEKSLTERFVQQCGDEGRRNVG